MKFTFAVQKMGATEIGRAKGHNCRTHPTASQLPRRAWFTEAGHHTIENWDDEKIHRAAALSKRKDAVVAISVVLQVGNQTDWRHPPSPEHPEGKPRKAADLNALAKASKAWLEAEFGSENVVSIEVHTDESTPHLQAVVTPVKDGKLQAKAWLNGPAKLAQMRERAHAAVAKVIPCTYDKGGPGGAPHDPEAAGGKKRPKPQPEPESGLLERLTGRKRITELEGENVKLRARNEQLESENKTLRQAAFSKAKARFRQAAETAAEAARDAAVRDAADAETKRDQAIQQAAGLASVVDLFTPSEIQRAKERLAEQKREQARLAELERINAEARKQMEKLDQERQRRAEQIPHLVKSAGGALATFVAKAKTALQQAAGDWRRVDWRGVEQDSLREAITRNKQEPQAAIADVLAHSPGVATPEQAEARKNELEATVGCLRPSVGPKNDYSGPHGP